MHEAVDSVSEDVAVLGDHQQIGSVGEQPLVSGSCSDGDRARYRRNANRRAHKAAPDGVLEDAAVCRHDEQATAVNENPLVFRACADPATE